MWLIIGHISNILGILSVVISFLLWLSFGKLKKEIESAKIRYAEHHVKISETLQKLYNIIFINGVEDNDAISNLRQQIYSIDRNFEKLLKKEDLKCVKRLMKILEKDIDKIDLSELRKHLDFIIITFKERIYDY